MHIAWTRHLLDNREFIVGGGTQPNTEPSRGEGLDGSATAEERDNYHRDAYENARNHASGPPAARGLLWNCSTIETGVMFVNSFMWVLTRGEMDLGSSSG